MNRVLSNKFRLMILLLVCVLILARTDLLQSKALFTLAPSSLSDTIPDIKVKIFPHSNGFIPHMEDSVKSRLKITSDIPFMVYETNSFKESQEVILAKTNSISLNAYKLKTPIILKGPAPFTLHRSSNLNSYTYRGQIIVYPIKVDSLRKYLLVVNKINVEEYLKGVVPSEIIPTWNPQALKTQTVAARTYAMFHMLYARKFSKNKYFDVDDSITYQVYTGISNEHPNTNQAIEETKGEILTFDNKVIQAYYHADAGGATDSAIDIWHKSIPYCISKKEPLSSSYKWEKEITAQELTKKLQDASLLLPSQKVKNIIVSSKTKTGRVLGLKIITSKNQSISLGVGSLKRIISLDSSKFKIFKTATGSKNLKPSSMISFKFRGSGFGHGIGMSQMGAQKLSSQLKWNYKKILHHYYTNINICSLHQKEDINKCRINDISDFNDVDIDFASTSTTKKQPLEARVSSKSKLQRASSN